MKCGDSSTSEENIFKPGGRPRWLSSSRRRGPLTVSAPFWASSDDPDPVSGGSRRTRGSFKLLSFTFPSWFCCFWSIYDIDGAFFWWVLLINRLLSVWNNRFLFFFTKNNSTFIFSIHDDLRSLHFSSSNPPSLISCADADVGCRGPERDSNCAPAVVNRVRNSAMRGKYVAQIERKKNKQTNKQRKE